MVPSFDDVYRLTDTVSSPAAFSRAECQAYYDLLTGLPDDSAVLEIGLHLGRSSSIIMQLQRAKGLDYHGIDPFEVDTAPAWMRLLLQTGARATVYVSRSESVALYAMFDLVLVDGDHSAEGVATDIRLAMGHLVPGGYVLFHDYTQADPHVRDVYPTVQKEMAFYSTIKEQGIVDRLGIWRDLNHL